MHDRQPQLHAGETKSSAFPTSRHANLEMQACMASGPFAISITVYPDLGGYKSGVYTCVGKTAGAEMHTIVVIGWGVQAGVDYW